MTLATLSRMKTSPRNPSSPDTAVNGVFFPRKGLKRKGKKIFPHRRRLFKRGAWNSSLSFLKGNTGLRELSLL